jgi:ABC-type multidrug transport system fused ATPase/permease subunit
VTRLRFLWRYASHWRWQIVLCLLALTFVTFTSLLYPWLIKHLIDGFQSDTPTGWNPSLLAGILVVVLIISALLGYYQQTRLNRIGLELRNALRRDFFSMLLDRPLGFYRENQVGELSALAAEEIAKVQPLFSHFVGPLFQNALFVAGALGMMVSLNWGATLLVLAVMTIPLPFVLRASRRIPRYSAEAQRHQGHAHALFEEALVAIREVKAFTREAFELRRYAQVLEDGTASEMAGSSLRVKSSQTVYLLLSLVLLAVFFAGASRTLFPGWSIGGLIAFYFYAYMMTMSVIAVERIYLTYRTVAGALDRIMTLLSHSEVKQRATETTVYSRIVGSVKCENVVFGYSEKTPVLNGISLSITAGEWVLITGPSGSGKSTLLNLLMGFYNPAAGRILIDGVEVTDQSARSLRHAIGYVGQDPLLIQGSLRDNIAFGGELPDDQLRVALETACLEDVLKALPDGFDSFIGERGYTLSGGQKARVAIARALALDPAILLLDEANVMIEPALENTFWSRLLSQRLHKTTIILTHHPGNIPRVDQHFRLLQGSLVKEIPGSPVILPRSA